MECAPCRRTLYRCSAYPSLRAIREHMSAWMQEEFFFRVKLCLLRKVIFLKDLENPKRMFNSALRASRIFSFVRHSTGCKNSGVFFFFGFCFTRKSFHTPCVSSTPFNKSLKLKRISQRQLGLTVYDDYDSFIIEGNVHKAQFKMAALLGSSFYDSDRNTSTILEKSQAKLKMLSVVCSFIGGLLFSVFRWDVTMN